MHAAIWNLASSGWSNLHSLQFAILAQTVNARLTLKLSELQVLLPISLDNLISIDINIIIF
ncbi:MAG: hypothetical protein ABJB85_09210, partial [Nitrososphaerota archaeon]